MQSLKKSAQKFDFASLDELETNKKKMKNELLQLEEELNVKQLTDQEYSLRNNIDNIKFKIDSLNKDYNYKMNKNANIQNQIDGLQSKIQINKEKIVTIEESNKVLDNDMEEVNQFKAQFWQKFCQKHNIDSIEQ